jgi:hypothetical protein
MGGPDQEGCGAGQAGGDVAFPLTPL